MCLLRKSQLAIFFLLFIQISSKAQKDPLQTLWNINTIDKIGDFSVLPLNVFPTIKGNKYLLFNGIDNALLIKGNPLGTASAFTIEVIIKPDSSLNSANVEQRFLHIGKSAGDKARILLELRLLKRQKWDLDVYLSSETSSITMIDTTREEHLYQTGKWYNVTLVYGNQNVLCYINGVKEFSGRTEFHPLPDAQISIGARQNPRSWFKGGIKTIRFTGRALKPEEFLKPEIEINN